MSKLLFSVLSCFIFLNSFNSFSQCNNYEEVLFEGFEYATTVPGYVLGSTYHSVPQTFCPHSGSKALYLNFVNGYSGLAYDWEVTACEDVSYEFSFWAKDCFSSVNNITVSAEDDLGNVLTSTIIITNNVWSQYTLGPFTSGISPLHFKISTNTAGGPGNDLSIDDISLKACTPDVDINADPLDVLEDGICTNAPINLFLPTAGINYTNPEFQWQISNDIGITWTDIPNTDTNSVELSGLINGDQIRCIIAESGNILDADCRYITEPVIITVFPLPVINPPNDYEICDNIDSAGFAAFNLFGKINELRTDPSDEFHFYSSLSDAIDDTLEAVQIGHINETNPDMVYIRAINDYGCVTVDSMVLIVNEQPDVNLGIDTSLCEEQPIILDATYNHPDATYLWHDGSTEPTFNVTDEGVHSVTVTLGPCTVYDEISVTLYQLPGFEFGPNIDKCIDDTVYLSSGIIDALSYTWNTGSSDPDIMVTEFGEYELTVETECGTHTDIIEIEPIFCGCPIYFPNSISPNGDGLNDYFILEPECEFENYDLLIYDRWGKEVFRSTNPNEIWFGPTEGEHNQTLYVYILKYTFQYSPAFEKKGTITIFQ